jgi:hypothetical protein
MTLMKTNSHVDLGGLPRMNVSVGFRFHEKIEVPDAHNTRFRYHT